MHDLYALKEALVKELEDYGKKGGLSSSSLDVVDKLAHAAKNVSKVIECCEEEEYSRAEGHSYAEPSSYYVRPDGSYRSEASMASYRGRGRGAKRDSMGRYSREGEMDEHTKEKLREMIDRL